MPQDSIKIITRRSQLAIVQAMMVQQQIASKHDLSSKLIAVLSPGDNTKTQFGDFNLKNLFTKNLDKAVLDAKADFAVHSLKDLGIIDKNCPLRISGFVARQDAHDILITKGAKNLSEIKQAGIYLTSSLRRKAQILAYDPLAKIYPIRGNIISRLKQFSNSHHISAMILAKAGILRLTDSYNKINPDLISNYLKANPKTKIIDFAAFMVSLKKHNIHFSELSFDNFLPAANQGQIACTVVENNTNVIELLDKVSDNDSQTCAIAERKFIARINANCHMPLACHAQIIDKNILFRVKFYDESGQILFNFEKSAPKHQHIDLAQSAANQFIKEVGYHKQF